MSEIQKVLNYPRGGGSSLIGNFSQIFPFFLVMAPLSKDIFPKKSFKMRLFENTLGRLNFSKVGFGINTRIS